MDIFIALITVLLLLFTLLLLLYFILHTVVEPIFVLAYSRPLYVHFYPVRKKLHPLQISFLESNHAFYWRLSPKYKSYFGHRVATFLESFAFAGREGLVVNDAMKLQIAATSVMLTFGMRNYLHRSLSVIVLYPDIYLSGNGEYHKGEFNPAARAVVFSWKHFTEGLNYASDNLNLGLHEFTHVMHFDARRYKGNGGSLAMYSDTFREITGYLADLQKRENLITTGYFREYAYTSEFEFVAVLLEHFFETPAEFEQKFPELYHLVKKMINYRESWR